MTIHVVRSGESVASIAEIYGVDPVRLASDNSVPSSGALAVGQTLVVRFPALVHTVQPGETLPSNRLRLWRHGPQALAEQLVPWRPVGSDTRTAAGDLL